MLLPTGHLGDSGDMDGGEKQNERMNDTENDTRIKTERKKCF